MKKTLLAILAILFLFVSVASADVVITKYYKLNNGQSSILPNSTQKIHWDGVRNMSSQSTYIHYDESTDYMVIKKGGYYEFSVRVRLGSLDTGATYYKLGLVVDGGNIAYNYSSTLDPNFHADMNYYPGLSIDGAVFYLNAGDKVFCYISQVGGTQQTKIHATASDSMASWFIGRNVPQ